MTALLSLSSMVNSGRVNSMAKPPVTEHWEAIKVAAMAGMTDGELSAAFGVKTDAIRQRRRREGWVTPASIERRAAAMVRFAQDGEGSTMVETGDGTLSRPMSRQPSSPTAPSQGTIATEAAATVLARLRTEHALLVTRYVGGKMQRAAEKDLLPEIGSWKEASIANGMVVAIESNDIRTVANAGGGMARTINIFAPLQSRAIEAPPCREIEAETVEADVTPESRD